ncbi:MAG: D-alanyl-D-alanine carboxypeptidase family protein [Bacillota bacterium]|nr:D-alanyl-D-alanine carboxypeptidase family protein [Bacillota bacterium]
MNPRNNKLPNIMFLCILLAVLAITINSPAAAESNTELTPPKLRASAAVLIEADSGRVLQEKNMHTKRPPASLTKMMTGILAIEFGQGNEIVTVSPAGSGNKVGQDIGLKRHDQLLLADLTKAALLVSANDSTLVIGEHIGGSEEFFINMMNMKARSIGAYNTSFKNTNGYTEPNHYSTAYDMALIARYAIQNPIFARIVLTDETNIKWLNKDKELTLINCNRLQRQYQWITGVKTGTTNAAGKCLVASGEREGTTLVAVVLNSSDRYGEALRMLEYGFSLRQKVIKKGEVVDQITIQDDASNNIEIKALEDVFLFIKEEEQASLETIIIYDQERLAKLPIEAGEIVGTLELCLGEDKIAQVPIAVGTRVEAKKWWQRH